MRQSILVAILSLGMLSTSVLAEPNIILADQAIQNKPYKAAKANLRTDTAQKQRQLERKVYRTPAQRTYDRQVTKNNVQAREIKNQAIVRDKNVTQAEVINEKANIRKATVSDLRERH